MSVALRIEGVMFHLQLVPARDVAASECLCFAVSVEPSFGASVSCPNSRVASSEAVRMSRCAANGE
jgi:hypothetical protein